MIENLKEFLRWWRRAKNPVGITEETQKRIQILFQPQDRPRVVDLLERGGSNNLPLLHNAEAPELERIHFAALKVSQGDFSKLVQAVELAQVDWRDLLVAAGFDRLVAHTKWIPEKV